MIFFFRKRLNRLVDPKKTEQRLAEEPLELERGDVPAIILAAFLVIGPIVLAILAMLGILYWLFTR